MQYVEQTIGPDPLIDSDRESNKSDDSDTSKAHHMYVWNPKYEVSTLRYNLRQFYTYVFCKEMLIECLKTV